MNIDMSCGCYESKEKNKTIIVVIPEIIAKEYIKEYCTNKDKIYDIDNINVDIQNNYTLSIECDITHAIQQELKKNGFKTINDF